jgi:peptidoglycan/LPS O-acetylase OafA/YrhL
MSQSAHKPFIDGLRAVAIVAVMAFHVGVPHTTGGFVGVDVFFVMSGFLIIGQLTQALNEGRHSLSEFWARRALRILPPYLLVVAASLVLGHYILGSAAELADLTSQVTWSAAMAANHYFLAQQGYFDTSADVKPLLHLWSLAVEEQFYLVAPLVLSGLWVFKDRLSLKTQRWLGVLIPAGLFTASLALCILYSGGPEEPNHAFFMMPLRAWEFVLGGVLPGVAKLVPFRSLGAATALAVLGLSAVLGAVFGYNEATPFPSFTAVLPVLGTSAVIVAGLVNEQSPPIGLLGSRPFTAIGLVSYSWYLWHWPLLAFGRIANFGERQLGMDALVAGGALVLAIITYWLVERPIRVWRQRTRPLLGWRVTVGGLGACALLATASALGRPPEAPGELDTSVEPAEPSDLCNFERQWDFGACTASARGQRLGLVMGDSHASRVRRLLAKKHKEERIVMARSTSGSCPPIFGVRPERGKGEELVKLCVDRKNSIEEALTEGAFRPEFVVLSSYWIQYIGGGWRALLLESGKKSQNFDQVFQSQVRGTLEKLLANGVRRILIVGPSPYMSKEIKPCAAQAKRQGVEVNKACGGPNRALPRVKKAYKLLKRAALGLEGVKLIDPVQSLCSGDDCPASDGKRLFYDDRHHLTEAALKRVYQDNRRAFEWVVGGGQGLPPPTRRISGP